MQNINPKLMTIVFFVFFQCFKHWMEKRFIERERFCRHHHHHCGSSWNKQWNRWAIIKITRYNVLIIMMVIMMMVYWIDHKTKKNCFISCLVPSIFQFFLREKENAYVFCKEMKWPFFPVEFNNNKINPFLMFCCCCCCL